MNASSPVWFSATPHLAQLDASGAAANFTGLHIAADALLAIACIIISSTVFFLVRSRPALAYPRLLRLFAVLFACAAAAHTFSAFNGSALDHPWSAGAKLLLSAVALVATFALLRAIPATRLLANRADLQRQAAELEERVAARMADLTAANEKLRREATHRMEAEAEVYRLNAELQTRIAELEGLFKLLPVGVAISTDANCRQVHANQALADLLGIAAGQNVSLSSASGAAPQSFRLLREGRELGPDELPMERATAQNAPVRDLHSTIARHDGATLEVIANAVPVRDAAGAVRGCVATFQDITAHKQAERQRLDFERKLLQSQKLESIGVLAGGIAHDFNNLLTGILGHANFARAELARGSTQVDHLLAQVELSAQRAAELCRQLLAYAGKGRFVVRLIDPNVAIEQAFPLFKLSASKKVSLQTELGSNLPPFRGDPTQLNQALLNLVTNASEAITGSTGTITLATDRVTLAPMDLLTLNAAVDMEAGHCIRFTVRDTGCGIGPETLSHIFEPFFTTKFVGRGLGLSAVLGIVHGHHGGVRVSSQLGVGTTFELFFPIAVAPQRVAPAVVGPESANSRPPTGSPHLGQVLVVDDDETVRFFAATALKTAGYSVVTANDGEEALATLRLAPTRFDAVLLDLTMPKLDGEDTLMALRMLTPNLPVILTTGHSEQAVAQRFVGRGLADLLAKPFVAGTLISSISAAIARSRAKETEHRPATSVPSALA